MSALDGVGTTYCFCHSFRVLVQMQSNNSVTIWWISFPYGTLVWLSPGMAHPENWRGQIIQYGYPNRYFKSWFLISNFRKPFWILLKLSSHLILTQDWFHFKNWHDPEKTWLPGGHLENENFTNKVKNGESFIKLLESYSMSNIDWNNTFYFLFWAHKFCIMAAKQISWN